MALYEKYESVRGQFKGIFLHLHAVNSGKNSYRQLSVALTKCLQISAVSSSAVYSSPMKFPHLIQSRFGPTNHLEFNHQHIWRDCRICVHPWPTSMPHCKGMQQSSHFTVLQSIIPTTAKWNTICVFYRIATLQNKLFPPCSERTYSYDLT
jgi:hypothetical protein